MTKDQARAIVLDRWRQLPDDLRLSYEVADAFALRIAGELDFSCYTIKDQLIAAWLIGEINRERDALKKAA